MLHEAGMLDTACEYDLIVNGTVNNQSSAASLITHEHHPDCSASLPFSFPFPTLLPAQHNLQMDTEMLPAISIFIQLLIISVYQSSFQVSVKPCSPSATQPPVLRTAHSTEDDLSKTQQSVEGSAMDTAEHWWVFSMTLHSQSRKDDTTQAIYSRTSDTSLKCCILEFLYGYGVFKGAWRGQAPNFHWPNKKLPYDLGKICY